MTNSEHNIKQNHSIKLFENKKVKVKWVQNEEKWYFSIIDVIAVLTDSPNPRKYWSVLKTRLKAEGSQLTTNCSQLKMESSDGKFYLTDVADTEQLLRLIQSIPSKKAEAFKAWLAKVGYDYDKEWFIDDIFGGVNLPNKTFVEKDALRRDITETYKGLVRHGFIELQP